MSGVRGLVQKLKQKIRKPPDQKLIQITPSDVENLNEARENEIAYLHVDKELSQSKALSLEEQLTRKTKINVNRALSKEELNLVSNEYLGALSIKRLMTHVAMGGKINIKSWDSSTVFGLLDDIVILRDGRIGVKTQNSWRPLITGPTAKSVFFNHSGLYSMAGDGFLTVCLGANGGYAENVMFANVPDIRTDRDGKIVSVVDVGASLHEMIAKKNAMYGDVDRKLGIVEKQLISEHAKLRNTVRQNEYNLKRAEIAEGEKEKLIMEAKAIKQTYTNLEKQLSQMTMSRSLAQHRARIIERAKDDWMKRVGKLFPEDAMSKAEAKVQDLYEFTLSIFDKISESANQAKPEPVKPPKKEE